MAGKRTSSCMNPAMAVALTASTQKVHWKMSSMVSRWKSNLLSASLFSRIMLADATQYARPGNTCGGGTSEFPNGARQSTQRRRSCQSPRGRARAKLGVPGVGRQRPVMLPECLLRTPLTRFHAPRRALTNLWPQVNTFECRVTPSAKHGTWEGWVRQAPGGFRGQDSSSRAPAMFYQEEFPQYLFVRASRATPGSGPRWCGRTHRSKHSSVPVVWLQTRLPPAPCKIPRACSLPCPASSLAAPALRHEKHDDRLSEMATAGAAGPEPFPFLYRLQSLYPRRAPGS